MRGQDNLFELAHNRICIADDGIFNQLLGDGATAGHDVPVQQIRQDGAHDAAYVIAGVLPEIVVLDGYFGVNKIGRNVVERLGDLKSLVNCFVDRCAMSIVHPQAIFR